ncbi:hypothetical protein [Nocardioides sp. SR21]|uniref:hypothetical protein n=1 Tax=Nocardioides sp. SR21 TaxID=2919501 RepID=UPI001FAB2B35|nr:hypothetical protein [Nocardioides sp. SR21]
MTQRLFVSIAATALALAGCSSTDADPDQLTSAQVEESLLVADSLGEGFEEKADDEDEIDIESPMGCLTALDDFDADVDATDASVRFAFRPGAGPGLPEVTNGTLSFATTEKASAFMDRFTDSVASCRTVDERAENGVEVRLDVALDKEVTVADADEQADLRADGTFSFGDRALRFSVAMSVVRSENNVVAVLTTDLAELAVVSPLTEEYTRLAVARLLAVADGDEAPDDAASVSPEPHTGPAAPA